MGLIRSITKISVLPIIAATMLFAPHSNAAKFDDFTLYNEFGAGAGASTMYITGSGATAANSFSAVTSFVDYRFGIREKYLFLVANWRAEYNALVGVDKALTGYRTGFGIGIEWDIPIRIYFGILAAGSGAFYEGFSDIASNTYAVTSGGSTFFEIGYYINQKMLISLNMESPDLGGSKATSIMSAMFTYQMDINYPEVSWRKRTPTENTASTEISLRNDEPAAAAGEADSVDDEYDYESEEETLDDEYEQE